MARGNCRENHDFPHLELRERGFLDGEKDGERFGDEDKVAWYVNLGGILRKELVSKLVWLNGISTLGSRRKLIWTFCGKIQ